MSYQVLARKWRPKNFAELMGQEHVVKALTGGLEQGRLHHAFLFTGTRGVGKTTIARIIAKALNCETGITATPCGQCSTCNDIDAGRYTDLMEIDAASRTKVDDTREILDNVMYAPARGRFKVYLIDEVHMLSINSFNALLKTLEEPPEHVKFVLATTDPQKLPITVLSRCLKFHLKRLSVAQIDQQMQKILQAEGVTFEAEAIAEIARAADGSMRDGLSLLDQALAFGAGKVENKATLEMLGTVSVQLVTDLLEALSKRDVKALCQVMAQVSEMGAGYVQVLSRLAEQMHHIAFVQAIGGDYVGPSNAAVAHRLAALAQVFDAEDLQLKFQFAQLGVRDVQTATDQRIAFEMCMLRMLAFTNPAVLDAPDGSNDASGQGAGSERAAPTSMANAKASTAAQVVTPTLAVPIQVRHEVTVPTVQTPPASTPSQMPIAASASANAQLEHEPPAVQVASSSERRDRTSHESATQPDIVVSGPLHQAQAADPVAASEVVLKLTTAASETVSLVSPSDLAMRWRELVNSLNLPAGPARELARIAVALSWSDEELRLAIDPAHDLLAVPANQSALISALRAHFTALERVSISIVAVDQAESPRAIDQALANQLQQAFVNSLSHQPLVQSLIEKFSATIVPGSVQSHQVATH
jgi:DNA polymerase III subunit gamma/tau